MVNFNGARFLAPCLTSIREKITLPFEVVLVDNRSSDGSDQFVEQQFPWVRLVRSEENLGFAGGNNLAARHAVGEYLLLLNTDTVLQTDVRDAVQVLDGDSTIGAVGAAMYRGDGSLATSCGRFPSPLRLWRFASLWYKPHRQVSFSVHGVSVWRGDYVEGSFLLTRASAWRELGGIDECNFLYGDDVEYCRSLLDLNLTTVQCPSVRYTHFGGYDHSRMGYLFAGFRRYHRKFSPRRTQLEADFVLRTGLLLRIPWYWLRAAIQKDNNSRSALRHAWDLNKTWKQSTGG